MSYKSNWDTKSINHYRTVQQIKRQLRQGNSAYLCNHPEIRAIIRVLIHEAINEKTENVPKFIANLFSCGNAPRLTIMSTIGSERTFNHRIWAPNKFYICIYMKCFCIITLQHIHIHF
nr:uncharacterized protein LOC118680155 isoform X2 [Bactrocera oleae]